jgi:hypothetical protein
MDRLPHDQGLKVHKGRVPVRIQLKRRISMASSCEGGLMRFYIDLISAFGPATIGEKIA